MADPTIADSMTTPNEVVITERVVTTDFRITEIRENINMRRVEVEIEFGPFAPDNLPGGTRQIFRGSSRRSMVIWENEEYDAIRDTWRNVDLIAAVKAKL